MSWLGNLFGGNQKKDNTYSGPVPYNSLRDASGGEDYYKTILGRMQGQGVGYGEGYADRNASPIVKNMRNTFNSYDIPELKSELSATGRRKGSAGFDQMRRAYQEQGLNEGDVFARLQQQNDVASHEDVNRSIEQLGAFNQNDYNARTTASNFYNQQNRDQVADATAQKNEGNAAFQRLLGQASLAMPTSGLQSMFGGGMQLPNFSSTDFAANKTMPWGQGGSMNDRLALRDRLRIQNGSVGAMPTKVK